MAGLTLAPEGSGSLAKQQLQQELLCLRSGWTQGCRMSENKQRKVVQETSMNMCILKQPYTKINNQKEKIIIYGQTRTHTHLLVIMTQVYTKPSIQVYGVRCIG